MLLFLMRQKTFRNLYIFKWTKICIGGVIMKGDGLFQCL